jgi:hypothetical protein
MINTVYAKDNGAYAQYQQEHHTAQAYVPESFDPSDGEWTNTEMIVCAVVLVAALIIVWRAFKGDQS